ncbi:MAG: Stf0 family sulfotransferase [Candidatus Binatia bacterium]|nr:Stf0 family sulfotransferase [Candidatus Binatia bacterium]
MAFLLDSRNGPAFDLPAPVEGAQTWIAASVPRSGSTLLCRTLWDTGGVGAPKEYLNAMQLRDWEVRLGTSLVARVGYGLLTGRASGLASGAGWTQERFAAHVERVRSRRSDASGRFGLKIHYHHFENWFLTRGWSVEDLLAPQRWVRISREDRVAQAVSWARALQTGRWTIHQRASTPSFYRASQIDRLVAEIERQEAGWDDYFASRGIAPFRLTYEELVGDLQGTIRRVLGFLGAPNAADACVADVALRRQANEVNARWIERYRASRMLGSG